MVVWQGISTYNFFPISDTVSNFHFRFSVIKPEYKPLLSDLCTEQVLMLIQPYDVKMRKKQRKIKNEVADLKQKLSECTKNIVLSNREIRHLR